MTEYQNPSLELRARVALDKHGFHNSHSLGQNFIMDEALLNGLLGHIDRGIGGLDQGQFVGALKEIFTFKAHMFGGTLEVPGMLCFVLALFALSLLVMVYTYSRNYKKK